MGPKEYFVLGEVRYESVHPEKIRCLGKFVSFFCKRGSIRSKILVEAKSWEKKLTAFQTVIENETFAKANSARLQKPAEEK